MGIDITTLEKENYLLIKAIGNINNSKEWRDLSAQYYEHILKSKINKIIIDELELDMPIGIVNQIELLEYINDELPADVRKLKIAVVIIKEYEDIGSFWETTMASRGYHEFKIFYDFGKAQHWVMDEQND